VPDWNTDSHSAIRTPIGFWMSPGMMDFRDAKKIIDQGIESKCFIHPWIHLVECSLREKDIDNFYRPLFEYVLSKRKEGSLEVLSFKEISRRLR